MNERIKELAAKAGLESVDFPYDEFGMSYEQLKFAKLIVEKCSKIADDCAEHGSWMAGYRIKQHFGVEE